MIYGLALCLCFLLILLYDERILQNVWIMNADSQSLIADDHIKSHMGYHRYKRNARESACPYYFQVNFNDTVFPGHKIERFCDRSAKSTCGSYCKEELRFTETPRLKLLGMKMSGNKPVYYFQEFYEEETVVCKCA